jgi:catechol 2,3-dioxygenase-like lactoylglutathione lyase family enzyme
VSGAQISAIGLELLISDISAAIAVFVDALGCELVMRGPSPDLAAELAIIDAGAITITLISPTDADRRSIPDVTPRLSQLVFGGSAEAVERTVDALRAAGIGVSTESTDRPFVPPAVMKGVVGFPTAVVLTPMPEDDE